MRAALLLLPLLGITNILDLIPGPVEGTPLKFAVWSYTTHVLSASQGFFISLLYCFLNREVRFFCEIWSRIYFIAFVVCLVLYLCQIFQSNFDSIYLNRSSLNFAKKFRIDDDAMPQYFQNVMYKGRLENKSSLFVFS